MNIIKHNLKNLTKIDIVIINILTFIKIKLVLFHKFTGLIDNLTCKVSTCIVTKN